MKNGIFSLICFFLASSSANANYLDDHLEKLNWDGLEVQWIEDSSTPIYDVIIKFQGGAITDSSSRFGETEMMFSQLTSGTTQYSQKEISEHLEYFGTQYGSDITHEYSILKVRGLVKDILPTMKMVCHLFKRATFPQGELDKAKQRYISSMKNLPTHPGAMVERAFRQISLKQTPFSNSSDGTIDTIKRIKSSHLHNKLKFFNEEVAKKIFIVGPPEIKSIQHVFKNDCNWSNKANSEYFGSEVNSEFKKENNLVHLITVPGSNQAQIRLGSHLTTSQINEKPDYLRFASSFLGGGFTSQLVTELRVKRGLTYSASAVAAGQKNYGRAVISTFTKNSEVVNTLSVIKDILDVKEKKYPEEVITRMKKYAKGNYLFSLESSSQFMNNLIYFDHIGRKYDEIYSYPDKVNSITQEQLKEQLANAFNWDHLAIVVLGDPAIKKDLVKAGYKVKVHSYKEFL